MQTLGQIILTVSTEHFLKAHHLCLYIYIHTLYIILRTITKSNGIITITMCYLLVLDALITVYYYYY